MAASAVALLTACGRPEPGRPEPGQPVRTPAEASEIAQQALRSAHLDEEVVGVTRQGRAWVVTTRWRDTSAAGHLVTVDAPSGNVSMERYRTIQLPGQR